MSISGALTAWFYRYHKADWAVKAEQSPVRTHESRGGVQLKDVARKLIWGNPLQKIRPSIMRPRAVASLLFDVALSA